MEIKSRLEALHAMSCMRRMELLNEDGCKQWGEMFDAVDLFFDPMKTSHTRETAIENQLDPVWIKFAYEH